MALVLDTRFLITYTFPPTLEDKVAIKKFFNRIIREEKVYLTPVIIAEYLKVAGKTIGIDSAEVMIKRFENAGVKVEPLISKDAIKAGQLSLKHPNIPLADILIAATTIRLKGKVVSDDPHFKILGLKTTWYKYR